MCNACGENHIGTCILAMLKKQAPPDDRTAKAVWEDLKHVELMEKMMKVVRDQVKRKKA